MESGMAQVMSVLANGKSVAVGLTGVEGFVGGPLVVGLRSPTRAITQMDSAGHRISAGDLETAVLKCSELERLLLRYSHELTIQSTQIAACNQFHSLGERMARLLLMTRDRLGDTFSITQQSISDLLGARRASVNVAVKIIQDARAISCGRGRLTIENLAVLKSASCECYQTINELARIAG
jgi:CRP-like cAMP-binding protein